jgi:hypothetical protein
MSKELTFEDAIEALVLEDAILFYNTGSITDTSRTRLEKYAENCNRDFEEAQVMHTVLFPHAYKWVGDFNMELNKDFNGQTTLN